jgi:hypothetical protein
MDILNTLMILKVLPKTAIYIHLLDPSIFEIKYPNSDIQGRVVSFLKSKYL